MNNVAERIKAFNEGRDPHLLQLKYRAMRTDAFAFLRGTCHLFYQDWPAESSLNEAPAAWLCGDLHWQNLGSYKGDNRLVYFQVNDFDEAALAPCTWDLARLLVSLLVGARTLNISEAKASMLGTYFLDTYAKELARGHVHLIQEDHSVGIVRDLLFHLKMRDRKAFLDTRTEQVGGVRKLRIDGKRALPISEAEREAVTSLMKKWAEKQLDPNFFSVLDVAHRVAGIGSLGVDRYVLLVEGKGSPDRNYLLDLKEECVSSLQPYLKLPQPHWNNQAERATAIQRWVQGVPPALLIALELNGKFYALRELQPQEDKINTEPLQGKLRRLEKLMGTVAQVVAWGQLRSAGRQGAAPAYDLMSFAQASGWKKALLKYAQAYSGRVEQDYREFCAAYDSGELSPGETASARV